MARPLAFPEANDLNRPPPGMEGVVVPLHVRRSDCCLISCWRLAPDEIAEILRTGVVWLSVIGHALPPIMISGRREEVL